MWGRGLGMDGARPRFSRGLRNFPNLVIPAQAGIRSNLQFEFQLMLGQAPAYAGVTLVEEARVVE